jgi:hypothetical protein
MDLTGFLSELAGLPTLFLIPRADVRQRLLRALTGHQGALRAEKWLPDSAR